MGVPGLWEYINKVGTSTSLVKLAIEAFEKNDNRMRAFRVGIDANIWMTHAQKSTDKGENPHVRLLMFRIAKLLQSPIIPLFVFDGRSRPNQKRGSRMGKSGSHALSQQFKEVLQCFGVEWREALGEAEAELAYLNQIGQVDAIVTDDVDALVFGAKVLLKNQSAELSGNRKNPALNANGKDDKLHYMVYRADDIKSNPDVALTRGGMILFALLSGGDYSKGLDKFGPVISSALARCGFGDELLEACQNLPPPDLHEYLAHWRIRVNEELRDNKQKFLRHRTNLVLPDSFPSLDVLEKYVKPVTNAVQGSSNSTAIRNTANLDLAGLAAFCEKNFEWGYKSRLLHRFRSFLWPCVVMHILRRSVLEADQIPGAMVSVGTSPNIVKRYLGKSSALDRLASAFVNQGARRDTGPETGNYPPLILKISKHRQHVSTDEIFEYRIEVSSLQIVDIASTGIKGTRPILPEKATKKIPDPPEKPFDLWMSASVMERVHPEMVAEYLATLKNKKGKGKKKQQPPSEPVSEEEDDYAGVYRSSSLDPPPPSSSYSNHASSSQPISQSRSQPSSQPQSYSQPIPLPASQPASRSASQSYARNSSPGPSPSQPPPQPRSQPVTNTQPHVHARQQPRSQPKEKAKAVNDYPEPPFVLNVVLEPWFTAPSLPLGRVNKHQLCRGFFFSFPHPDADEPVEEEEPLVPQPAVPPQPAMPPPSTHRQPAVPQRSVSGPQPARSQQPVSAPVQPARAQQPPRSSHSASTSRQRRASAPFPLQELTIDDEADFERAEMQLLGGMGAGGSEYEDEQPRNFMDRVMDQIINAPKPNKKAAKRKAPVQAPAAPAPAPQPPAKRPRTSKVLKLLDTMEF